MSAEMTEFVDVLPLTSINTCLSLVRGQAVGKRAAGLAILNLASYAAGQFLPAEATFQSVSGGQMMSATPLSLSECEAILVEMAPDAEGTIAMQKIGDGKLLELVKTLLPLLLKILL